MDTDPQNHKRKEMRRARRTVSVNGCQSTNLDSVALGNLLETYTAISASSLSVYVFRTCFLDGRDEMSDWAVRFVGDCEDRLAPDVPLPLPRALRGARALFMDGVPARSLACVANSGGIGRTGGIVLACDVEAAIEDFGRTSAVGKDASRVGVRLNRSEGEGRGERVGISTTSSDRCDRFEGAGEGLGRSDAESRTRLLGGSVMLDLFARGVVAADADGPDPKADVGGPTTSRYPYRRCSGRLLNWAVPFVQLVIILNHVVASYTPYSACLLSCAGLATLHLLRSHGTGRMPKGTVRRRHLHLARACSPPRADCAGWHPPYP
jgi:hypothetical protein